MAQTVAEAKPQQDRKAGMAKIISRFVEEPDSVVVFPFGGRKGAQFAFSLLNLDRALNTLKLNAVFVVPMQEVRECLDEAAGIATEIWEVVKRYVPRLYDFNPARWRSLNDPIAEKRLLIQRRNVWCLLPRSE